MPFPPEFLDFQFLISENVIDVLHELFNFILISLKNILKGEKTKILFRYYWLILLNFVL